MNQDPNHPTWAEVLDALEDPSTGGAALERHLESCSRCARVFETAQRLLARLEGARLPPVPDSFNAAALELVLAEAERAGTVGGGVWEDLSRLIGRGILRIQGALVADSLVPSAALRGSTEAGPRLLLFETDDFSISVSLTSASPGVDWNVLGQLSPQQGVSLPPEAEVALRCPGFAAMGKMNEFGEFSFPAVSGGPLQLRFLLGQRLLEIGPIETPPASEPSE